MVQFSDETILLSTVTQSAAADDFSNGKFFYILFFGLIIPLHYCVHFTAVDI